ncbi:MAG: hypothetical protein mread185_000408 [Mycoplasmataceae bacterium]|nr:MAG: hypothetical protein mread185_000408 [Mycoplasmataceae bacterium]
MSELENIRSLEKYDAWKKAKQSRKSNIGLIAGLIGCLVGFLLTWAILKVGGGDLWTLTKTTFASEDKIMECKEKTDKIDDKLKKSILASPLNWASKKLGEEAGKEILKGNLSGAIGVIRIYCVILIFAWLIVFVIIYSIFYYLFSWIIGKWFWKEPLLSSQRIDF